MQPPPTPLLPTGFRDVSMLFDQRPVFEGIIDDSMWVESDDQDTPGASSSKLPLAQHDQSERSLVADEHLSFDDSVERGRAGSVLTMEPEVLMDFGQRVFEDIDLGSWRSRGGTSVRDVSFEVESIRVDRTATPNRDDFFQRRMSSCHRQSLNAFDACPSPFLPDHLRPARTADSPILPLNAHPLVDPSSSSRRRDTLPPSSSLGSQMDTFLGEDRETDQVCMAWKTRPEMVRAQHVRTGSAQAGYEITGLPAEAEMSMRRKSRPRSSLLSRILSLGTPRHSSTNDSLSFWSIEVGRAGASHRSFSVFSEPSNRSFQEGHGHQALQSDDFNHPQTAPSHAGALIPDPIKAALDRLESSGRPSHSQLPSAPLRIAKTSGQHAKIPSSSTMPPSRPISMAEMPFPLLEDTSMSENDRSIDAKAEKRMSKSEMLMGFFANFLSGGQPATPGFEDTLHSDAALDHGLPDGEDEVVEVSRQMPPPRTVTSQSDRSGPLSVAPTRLGDQSSRPAQSRRPDYITLTRPMAPSFALRPSRTVPSASSNSARAAQTGVSAKAAGKQPVRQTSTIATSSSSVELRRRVATKSAFAAAALSRLPPPGKGSSAAGQPVTIRATERAHDLASRKSVFEGPTAIPTYQGSSQRVERPSRPQAMKKTIPLHGHTPGKASRARAERRLAFDQGVRERTDARQQEKRKLDRVGEGEEEAETRKKKK